MKRGAISLLLIVFFISNGISQIKLTYRNHALLNGENNMMKITSYRTPGPAGTNQLWDFSSLNKVKDFTGYLNEVMPTKSSESFGTSNTELIEFGNSFFFNVQKDKMEMYGYQSQSGNVRIEYSKPFLKMKYPFRYGDAYSGTFAGTYYLNNTEGPVNGTYDVQADAFGTLILPNGKQLENTLRVKTIKKYDRTLNNNTNNIEITTYRWYTEEIRYPVLVLIQTLTTTQTGKTYTSNQAAYREDIKAMTTNISLTDDVTNVTLYPNPFKQILQVDYHVIADGKVMLELYDNAGKKVKTLLNEKRNTGDYTYELDAQEAGLTHGVYYLNSTLNGVTKSNKIVYIK